jgi:hypothetical protein
MAIISKWKSQITGQYWCIPGEFADFSNITRRRRRKTGKKNMKQLIN